MNDWSSPFNNCFYFFRELYCRWEWTNLDVCAFLSSLDDLEAFHLVPFLTHFWPLCTHNSFSAHKYGTQQFYCIFTVFYVYVLHFTQYIYCMCACGFQKKSIVSPETSVTGHCEIPGVCWELNPGLLQGQPLLLNNLSSPSFVCWWYFFLKK